MEADNTKEAITPEYCVGFAFNEDMAKVLLQLKAKPGWQRNRWNGPGGHIEPGETPLRSMEREWREETPPGTGPRNWRFFANLWGDHRSHHGAYRLHCFWTVGDITYPVVHHASGISPEALAIFSVNQLPLNVLPNVHWLVAMALSFARGETCSSFKIAESQDA